MNRAGTVVIIMALAIQTTVIGVYLALPGFNGRDVALPSLLFPFALLFLHLIEISSIPHDYAFCAVVFGLAQFPLYGVLLAGAYLSDRFKAVAWRLVALHMLLGIGCALIYAAE